ncbi:uncharacterized protein LOC115883613 [Sitophilus oryzae]|uniref:Uncharacterized protein LOC115883613 n=1 Tax=Sitophilus oryzae TaxID=7048 RepID=A0A6J2Y4F0_SITOR|nr:uncharacterized protein LOC115883613 [Sitophilus oryzae]
MGLPVDDDTTVYTLSFGDDWAVVAQDIDDLEYMTRNLIEEYEKWGLELNIKKTEYMCISGHQQDLRLATGQVIRHCNSYKYLGIKIFKDGTLDEAILERNMQGRKAVSKLNGILWDKNITIENKKKNLQFHQKAERTLKATEMDFWRRSAGKSRKDKIPNKTISRQMQLKHDIVDDIRTQQLIWYGHVQRMEEHRIPKKILNWNPQGRRKR